MTPKRPRVISDTIERDAALSGERHASFLFDELNAERAVSDDLAAAGHELCRVIALEPLGTLMEAINHAYEQMKTALERWRGETKEPKP